MSIDPAELERIKTVAILIRQYFAASGLLSDDVNQIMDLIMRFRSQNINAFVTALNNFRDFLATNNITRVEVVKAIELVRLLK